MTERTSLATYCGIAGTIVSLGTITVATIVASPETFTWQGHALSDMGRYGTPTFPLFNGGLIVGGLLGLPFAWRCWITSRNALERVGVGLLATAVVGQIGVGLFFLEHTAVYLETSLHGIAALTVFGVAPFAGWIYGSGAAMAGDGRLAIASVGLGTVHPLVWFGWLLSLGGAAETGAWFAVAEFGAAVAFGGWILVLAITVRDRDDSEPDGPNR
ncbi:DUF998 domain-containing protein [Natrinema altunense]|uniref:DUF998 domain-containing protein n=1 Tax=Natrinema altunense (strain JCM 12890 / CGMCC 1.3731 / AJ2) TaxID=1227494 RepID=L9ZU90_NATA2|nr:DUF998 domain-containing protein [Natrinema altunense]ELY89656.1 hypothetical protein C485_04140 [Natrinema altunense JCM 12890]